MGAGRTGGVKDLHLGAARYQFCGNRKPSDTRSDDRIERHADQKAWK
jgi:hypothetical protein